MTYWQKLFLSTLLIGSFAQASENDDQTLITRAALDYIESQHQVDVAMMDRALHPKLVKRTFWHDKEGQEFVMETSKEVMLRVAASYNKNGDRFPTEPTKKVEILALDGRIAMVKLTADEWLDYMQLFKNDAGQWQIVNVVWQYHDLSRHQSGAAKK
ncbi:nuclear transport factor 2 family protein [Pseudoalteromonas fenneropenaei]|uniref:Nuclear transport factor 2 family protein n=1 Tax=Pseudoalteromonas fenneropenaei TaxID=1737459 RepID=A0ABV7CI79_9GAMM